MSSYWRPESRRNSKRKYFCTNIFTFQHKMLSLLILHILIYFSKIYGQFYNIYPATYVVPNKFQLNSSSIPLGAFLSLTAFDGTSKVARTSFDVICIECQKKYINDDPDLLPNTKLDILYYDTSFLNTSKASIAALEFSLTSNHIASFGKIKINSSLFIL